MKRAFNPEFLNRLDDMILFQSLTDDDLIKIMVLLVEGINKNLEAKQIKIHLSKDAAKYIAEEDLRGSELRSSSAAARAAEVY